MNEPNLEAAAPPQDEPNLDASELPPGVPDPLDEDLPRGLGPLRAVERVLFWAEQILLVAMLTALVVLAFLQVVNSNWLTWSTKFTRHLVLLIAFVGASLATREGRHLAIDILPRLLPPRGRVVLKGVIGLISAGVCVLVAMAAREGLEYEDNEAFALGSIEVSTRTFYWLIVAAFGLIAARFVIRAAKDFWHGWTGRLEAEAPRL